MKLAFQTYNDLVVCAWLIQDREDFDDDSDDGDTPGLALWPHWR